MGLIMELLKDEYIDEENRDRIIAVETIIEMMGYVLRVQNKLIKLYSSSYDKSVVLESVRKDKYNVYYTYKGEMISYVCKNFLSALELCVKLL